MIPTLETDRLMLRPLGPDDIKPLADFYASPRSSFVGGPLTDELAWRVLAGEIGHWTLRGFGRWSVRLKSTDEVIGLIGLWEPFGWPEPEIGWDLYDGFEGKGYATEAGKAARDYAYGTLNWPTAISLVADGNDGSARVAQRLGCREDGRFTHVRFGTMTIWRHPGPGASA